MSKFGLFCRNMTFLKGLWEALGKRQKHDGWKHRRVPGGYLLYQTVEQDFPDLFLNDGQALYWINDRERVRVTLETNRLPCFQQGPEDDRISRQYLVHVFDQQVVRVESRSPGCQPGERQQNGGGTFRVINPDSDRESQRLAMLARRTLHVLGLDFGSVLVGLDRKRGKEVVMEVCPEPELTPELADCYAGALVAMAGEVASAQLPLPVCLGADPEFMLADLHTGRLLPASLFFPRAGAVGCDGISRNNRHQFPVAEVRPDPSPSPLELAGHIKQILLEAARRAPYGNVKWLAGSQPFAEYATGGHIHFSGIRLSAGLLRALDSYLALPVLLLENPVTAAARRQRYGCLGDYRLKEHGGFEYRTTGSWLVSPDIARAVLCLAKVVASNHYLLKARTLSRPECQAAFYRCRREFFKEPFRQIWEELGAVPEYRKFERELSLIPEMVQKDRIWDEQKDIRRNWRLPVYLLTYRDSGRSGGFPGMRGSIYSYPDFCGRTQTGQRGVIRV